MSTPATSTSTDPVQTIIDLLSGTPKADWPTTKPDWIETRWTSTHHQKRQREGGAVYAWSPAEGTREPISVDADVSNETEVVFAECWHPSSSDAASLANSVATILEQYWKDNKEYTTFRHVRPVRQDDRRAEHVPGARDPFVVVVRVELRTEDVITSAGSL